MILGRTRVESSRVQHQNDLKAPRWSRKILAPAPRQKMQEILWPCYTDPSLIGLIILVNMFLSSQFRVLCMVGDEFVAFILYRPVSCSCARIHVDCVCDTCLLRGVRLGEYIRHSQKASDCYSCFFQTFLRSVVIYSITAHLMSDQGTGPQL